MSAPNLPYSRQPRYPYAPTQQRLNPWLLRLLLLFFSGVLLLVFVMMMLVAGYEFLHQGEIYPGVSTVFGVDLAGMSRQEAMAALSERFVYADDAVFVFRYGDQTWQFTARDLGVELDVAATVDAAYHAGRSGSQIDKLLDQYDIRANGYPIQPVITYNQTEAERVLTETPELDFVVIGDIGFAGAAIQPCIDYPAFKHGAIRDRGAVGFQHNMYAASIGNHMCPPRYTSQPRPLCKGSGSQGNDHIGAMHHIIVLSSCYRHRDRQRRHKC